MLWWWSFLSTNFVPRYWLKHCIGCQAMVGSWRICFLRLWWTRWFNSGPCNLCYGGGGGWFSIESHSFVVPSIFASSLYATMKVWWRVDAPCDCPLRRGEWVKAESASRLLSEKSLLKQLKARFPEVTLFTKYLGVLRIASIKGVFQIFNHLGSYAGTPARTAQRRLLQYPAAFSSLAHTFSQH